MSRADETMSLESFLLQRAPDLEQDLRDGRERIRERTGYLCRHLMRHPDLGTQVARLGDAIPETIVELDESSRREAVTTAEALAADVKARWIDADDPPLVDEIDDHLEEINGALERLRRPGPEALREAARRIDQLGRAGARLNNVEQRYIPWAMGGAVLFVLGLIFLINPGLLETVPFLASFWTILFCLGALPAVGIHYARTVLPRSQADTEIDDINREHFVPAGGIYFPQGEGPACVVTFATEEKELTPGQQARIERRRHKRYLDRL